MGNILYNDLIRRGFSIDVGAIQIRNSNTYDYAKIDFVVNKLDTKIYIQSAFQMSDTNKISHEISLLC